MPLLQGQPFRLIKPPDNLQPDQEVYVIQHTGEKFIGKSDYEDRLALYSQSIWSCQCTGKSGLTHQEAWTSEQKVRVQLEGSFPPALRGPILAIVHQSTAPLDQLVETAHHQCNARFHRGEELELKSPQLVKVKVVRVHKNKGETSPQKTALTNGCSPPSTPTMNGNGIAENGSSSSSPNDGKGKEDSPGKKMLPYLYDVAILGDDRTITEVPADHLQRVSKIPPKEHFRLFVRANAIRPRASSTTPWMVRDELVKRHNIPNKLPSIFNMKPQPQKRKAEEPLVGEVIKKAKEEIKSEPSSEIKPTPKLSPIQMESDEKTRKKPGPKAGSTHSPKKLDESGAPKEYKKRGPKPGSKRTAKMDISSHFIKKENGDEIKVENGMSPIALVKDDGSGKKRGRPAKQLTLFDVKTPNKSSGGSNKSQNGLPKKSPKKRLMTPEGIMNLPLMRKLVYEHKNLKGVKGTGRKLVYTMDLAIKKLNREQIMMIPDESLREDLLARQIKVMEQKILADMSPEDKEEYLKQKSKDESERRRLAKNRENMKVEDRDLKDLKSLPQPKMVPTPEVIPNSLFGDIVMITEFLQCYRELLMPEEDINLSTSQLMDALAAGPNGFKATADIFCILLKTIIRDETSKNIKELKVPLRDLPVTYQTATEMARQFLRRQDTNDKEKEDHEKGDKKDEEEEDDDEDEFVEEIELSDDFINKLEETELFELELTEVISMLKALCHRVMTTNTVAEYFDDLEEKYNQLHRENANIKKMKKKEDLDEKTKKKEARELKKIKKLSSPKKGRGRPKGSLSPKKSPSKAIETNAFYKKPSEEDEGNSDMASRVKRQRKTAEEKKAEKLEDVARRREEREKRQQEQDIEARLKHNENIARRCEEILAKKDLVNRQQPLGYDRDHNRYWLFHGTTPGIYVEKGWVDPVTMYSVTPEFAEPSIKHNSDDESDVKEGCDPDSPKKIQGIREPGARGRAKFFIEDVNALTIPPLGQNLWFYFDTVEDVDALINSLAEKGLRESQLKDSLVKNKVKIEANLLQKWEPLGEEDLQDGRQQIMQTARDDILQIEREIVEGWFGAVPNYDEWEKKTSEASTIQELGQSLIEVQKHMQKKYLKNFMKPMLGVMNSVVSAETDQQIGDLEECEPRAVLRWRSEIENCQTFSRLHMMVGMFDTCIRWEKSMATKKCKICRSKDKSDPLVLCDKCEGSYHWYCLRPQIWEEPAAPWFCSGCAPKKSKRVKDGSKEEDMASSEEEYSEEEEIKQEEVCRVCVGRMSLIFCSTCPAAYHSECHDPPLTSRARKDWKCVDCVKNPPKPKPERKPNSIARFFDKSKSKKRQSYSMDDSEDDSDRKSSRKKSKISSRKKSKSSKQTRSGRSSKRASRLGDDSEDEEGESPVASRRSSRTANVRKKYIDETDEETDEEAEEEGEEEEEEEAEEEEDDQEEEEDEEGEDKANGADEKEDNRDEESEDDNEKDDEHVENEHDNEEEEDDNDDKEEDDNDEKEDEDDSGNEDSEQSNATSDED